MPTITIPTKTIKNADLILVPRQEYEELIRAREILTKTALIKRSPSFHAPKEHKKYYDKLDKELTESMRDYYSGNYYGPFETAEETIHFLRRKQ
ncbi:MAG: hypothetical protein HYT98_04875 [Candidatus Sungbacteria bacterium]|nr:hypothetical protein [Candidatus Sungbacteria bacterium]